MSGTEISRRALIWAVPVVAVAVATPLAAASAPVETPPPGRDRLRFTNVTLRQGKHPNTLYFNTKVQVIDGPEPVTGLSVHVRLSRGGEQSVFFDAPISGWGNSGLISMEFPGIPKGDPVTVTVVATALNVNPITGTDTEETPKWWN